MRSAATRPVLTTRNALIGQPATTIAELEVQIQQAGLPAQTIFQWARDRTPYTTDYSITATRPMGNGCNSPRRRP